MIAQKININANIRCQTLDIDGNQCPNMAQWSVFYHGDPEIYSFFNDGARWVKIFVCDECKKKMEE